MKKGVNNKAFLLVLWSLPFRVYESEVEGPKNHLSCYTIFPLLFVSFPYNIFILSLSRSSSRPL